MRLIYTVLEIVGGLFLLTQLIIPGVCGRKVFPMFRSKKGEIMEEMADVRDEADVEVLEHKLEEMKPHKEDPAPEKNQEGRVF